ncbi:uncharacterized protein [Penaeus vannamei]|uniref:uncharacterized protein n=1 Tax=Penaeus vannamei TaxID=6689 RepID=UPI000F6668A2|nr:uncharacterized protein LOC113819712 [Penaeus vannamei]
MDFTLKEVWRRTLCCLVSLVILQLLGDTVSVANGEFLHKNDTNISEDSTAAIMDKEAPEENNEGGEVRCHCNLPRCVTVGYMCKSSLGACFTRPTPMPTPAPATRRLYQRRTPTHGCLELLPEDRHAECATKAGVSNKSIILRSQKTSAKMVETTSNSASRPTPSASPTLPPADPNLTCCSQDMCNYRDLDVFIRVDKANTQKDYSRGESEMLETVWFRAATIAVPIAGGFILIVLVFLASRMLAKENKRQRMAQVINERYLKAPLYPGGCAAEPLPPPQHSLYYHPPLLKNISLGHVNLRASYEDKPPSYRSPGMHVCSLEEIRPLNGVMGMPDGGGGGLQGGVHWDQRGAESPLPS